MVAQRHALLNGESFFLFVRYSRSEARYRKRCFEIRSKNVIVWFQCLRKHFSKYSVH